LLFCQEVGQFLNPSNLIVNTKMDETITSKLHIMQVTQTMIFFEIKAKTILNIGCDRLGPNMAIIFFVQPLHL
jgi:hypothetical protein